MRSTQEAREREDWEVDVSVAVADYAWMEGRAHKVETIQESVVPGLLQTTDYAREVLPMDPSATPQQIERTLAARIVRQRRLADEDPLALAAVIGEGALRLLVGGPEVMRAQLKHLVDVAAQPNVGVRILPFATGSHAGMTGPFTLLRFREDQDVATIETRGGDVYMEDVQPFARALRRVSSAALPQRKSLAMIAAIRRELT